MTQHASNKTLLLATLGAVLLAVVIYYIAILPAEYNQDPSGLGEKLGLTVLSTSPTTLAETDQISTDAEPVNGNQPTTDKRVDEVTVKVPAGSGVEYKFFLEQHAKLTYEWKTIDNSALYFDFHGEPEGDTTGFFESYTIATSPTMQGTATMPFAGSHGWYWKNTTDQDIRISLKTSGHYEVIGLK